MVSLNLLNNNYIIFWYKNWYIIKTKNIPFLSKSSHKFQA